MAEIEDPVFVDGTFEAGNIIYGRTLAASGTSNTNRTTQVTFGQDGVPAFTAGSGNPVVVITGYGASSGNRLTDTTFVNVAVGSPSPTGFQIISRRRDTAQMWFFWIAMRNP